MGGENKFALKRHHALLLIILFIIIGNIIYILPNINYSPLPTQWGVDSGWGRYYVANYGTLPEKNVNALTWESALADYSIVDVLPKILTGVISIVTGNTTLPDNERFNQIFTWVGLLFLPLIVLYFYGYVSKKEGKFSYLDCCLLYLFAIFPFASSTMSMSLGLSATNSVARVLFIFIIILYIIVSDTKDTMKLIVLLILLIPFFYYHHTWSYYLAIYLTVIGALSLLKKDGRMMVSLSFLGLIIFLVSAIYYNYILSNDVMKIIVSFPLIIANFPSVSPIMKVNSDYLGYSSLNSFYSYLQLANSLIILAISLFFILGYILQARKGKIKLYERILFYCLVAQLFVGFALFIWEGVFGVYSRIFEALVYISLLLAAYLLIKTRGKIKHIIRFTLLIAVCICIVSFLIYPSELKWGLTKEEYTGVNFAGNHIPTTSFVFSDFRLGMPLVYFGQQGIKTIDGLHNTPKTTESILEKSYYNVSDPETILDKYMGRDDYFVMISKHQNEVYILDTSLQQFKSASKDFQEKWSDEKKFNHVYSSAYMDIFSRA